MLFKNLIMSHAAHQLYACLFADCQPPMIRSVIKRALSKLKFRAACCISNEFNTQFQHWRCCLLKVRASYCLMSTHQKRRCEQQSQSLFFRNQTGIITVNPEPMRIKLGNFRLLAYDFGAPAAGKILFLTLVRGLTGWILIIIYSGHPPN